MSFPEKKMCMCPFYAEGMFLSCISFSRSDNIPYQGSLHYRINVVFLRVKHNCILVKNRIVAFPARISKFHPHVAFYTYQGWNEAFYDILFLILTFLFSCDTSDIAEKLKKSSNNFEGPANARSPMSGARYFQKRPLRTLIWITSMWRSGFCLFCRARRRIWLATVDYLVSWIRSAI